MKRQKILTVKQIANKNDAPGVILSDSEKYDNYIFSVTERADFLHSAIMRKKLEFAKFIYESVEVGARLFKKEKQKVFQDILRTMPGVNYSLKYPTFHRYYKTYKFIVYIKEHDKLSYEKLMIRIKNGATKWSHVATIERASLSDEQKMYYIKRHVKNDPEMMTSSAIRYTIESNLKYKTIMYSNLWTKRSVLKNFEFRYIKECEKFFLPFGSDGRPGKKCFQPETYVAKTFIENGFTEDGYTPEEDCKYDGVLVHPPQYNFVKRKMRNDFIKLNREEYEMNGRKKIDGSYQYETFDVSSLMEFIEKLDFIIKESYRVTKKGGYVAVVGWNVPVWGAPRRGTNFLNKNEDVNNEIREMLARDGYWEDTIVMPIEKTIRRYFSTCAYRTIHIFMKK
jgi:hypothetical protein